MSPCTQARILTAATRTLAVAAAGVAAWYVAQPVAQYFGHSLTDLWQFGVGGIVALIALFVSKRALDFTQDCMTVPDAVARAAHGTRPATCRKKSCRSQVFEDPADKPKAQPDSPDISCDGGNAASQGLTVTVADSPSVKVEFQAGQSATTVTVTISGVSAAKFKDKQCGLRKKIESVGGVKWDNPKNLGNNSRRITGRITDSTRREAIIARLQEIARGQ